MCPSVVPFDQSLAVSSVQINLSSLSLSRVERLVQIVIDGVKPLWWIVRRSWRGQDISATSSTSSLAGSELSFP